VVYIDKERTLELAAPVAAYLPTPAQGVRHAVAVNDRRADGPVDLTVIVPTYDEVENVPLLLERLGAAMAPLSAEILVVDDSEDGTPDAVTTKRRPAPYLCVCCTGHRASAPAGSAGPSSPAPDRPAAPGSS
jgi:hypothetical protein